MTELLLYISALAGAVAVGLLLILTFRKGSDAGAQALLERLAALKADVERIDRTMRQDAAASRTELADTQRKNFESFGQTLKGQIDGLDGRLQAVAKAVQDSLLETGKDLRDGSAQLSQMQRESLEGMVGQIKHLGQSNAEAQERLRESLERNLKDLREQNAQKLDEMRRTVDEQLQGTLEKRLGESFKLVSEQLQAVHAGLGEMQTLATGVGDLKRVLTNVKSRGTWGEVQLGAILEDMLTPDQFDRNVKVDPTSNNIVEYCLRFPSANEDDQPVLMPLDAKFPAEDYERLTQAAQIGDAAAVEAASAAIDRALRAAAKDIATKYIRPPATTDYAVMFLPSEGLYAEAARRPGLIEALNREFRVMVAGPSNLIALLNAVRVGFRSVAIQKQAGEVRKVLEKVRQEFTKYGEAVAAAHKSAEATVEKIGKLQTRQNVLGRALKGVDQLGPAGGSVSDALLADLDSDG